MLLCLVLSEPFSFLTVGLPSPSASMAERYPRDEIMVLTLNLLWIIMTTDPHKCAPCAHKKRHHLSAKTAVTLHKDQTFAGFFFFLLLFSCTFPNSINLVNQTLAHSWKMTISKRSFAHSKAEKSRNGACSSSAQLSLLHDGFFVYAENT